MDRMAMRCGSDRAWRAACMNIVYQQYSCMAI
jgi:hypothetical protein